ncbi:MAG TPA: SMC-Scp complex subunit ScpB [Alphaproteobacteria bacterium]|jgi:segregation and condensation protein B|nr:SMC-Scp complex subunit ScpB [Alphaproteobacteria bacterium]MDP7428660.1 SMC-Scp complex subunit ScpB [Alphaproteobacteria bacterium]HJM51579.1 SMC-Scp complex subunit ScpB [Alphaproteobacteria bacterium]|tara:strand:+ start:401 stop:1051 length:651 start_codon:yes stop_codon:yes gene_type:complete
MTEEKAFLRMVEALLFAADEPLDEANLAARLPDGAEVPALLAALAERYADSGVNLVRVAGKWALRTAPDLKFLLERQVTMPRRLSRAAVETLAIIAYNQPVTRAEIEEIRGVGLSRGTLDLLLETGWVRLRGRRRSPGRPATWGTSEEFLEHFGLESVDDLPGLDELKAAGMLQAQPPRAILAEARAEAATQDDEDDEDEDTDDDADDTLIALDPS